MNTMYCCSDGCGALLSEEDMQCSSGELCGQCQTYFCGAEIEVCEPCFSNALTFDDLCEDCVAQNEN